MKQLYLNHHSLLDAESEMEVKPTKKKDETASPNSKEEKEVVKECCVKESEAVAKDKIAKF